MLRLDLWGPENLNFHPAYVDHKQVVHMYDNETGLRAFIVVHSVNLGMWEKWGGRFSDAFGGIRRRHFKEYARSSGTQRLGEELQKGMALALNDCLRLSRGMTFKNALSGIPYDGAKAVMYDWREGVDRDTLFGACGRGIAEHNRRFPHRYFTAEDAGTTVADMDRLAKELDPYFIAGRTIGEVDGDPSPYTAKGVFDCMKVALGRQNKRIEEAVVVVQGVGNVGTTLVQLLSEAGARIIIADIDEVRVARILKMYPGITRAVSPEKAHRSPADIFAPCALGGTLNKKTIPLLKSSIVVGAANNQLEGDGDGERLHKRGILYGPDYVVNAGGVIRASGQLRNQTPEHDDVMKKVGEICGRFNAILAESESSGQSPAVIADRMARRLVYGV